MKILVINFLCLLFLVSCTPDSLTLQNSSASAANANEFSNDNVNALVEANNRSEKPAISADGQLVAFVSKASNLVSMAFWMFLSTIQSQA